jgi:hypothetical protein
VSGVSLSDVGFTISINLHFMNLFKMSLIVEDDIIEK